MALTKKRQQLRLTGYGASEVGALAGLSKFKKPIDVYTDRIAERVDEPSLAAELGTLLEGPIAKKHAQRTGLHLVKCATLRHRLQTFALAIATPDRLAFEVRRNTRGRVRTVEECDGAVRNVQIKTASIFSRADWGEDGTDGIPDTYLAQVQWEMGVTGVPVTDVPVLFDKAEFAVFRVPFNQRLFEALYEVVERFHVNHVLAKVPPPPDASDNYKEWLTTTFTAECTTKAINIVQPGSEVDNICNRYRRLKRLEKLVDENLKLTSNQVRAAIGDAQGLAGTFGELKWLRKPGTYTTDWEALARASIDPDELNTLVNKFQKQRGEYSQLRATWSDLPDDAPVLLQEINSQSQGVQS